MKRRKPPVTPASAPTTHTNSHPDTIQSPLDPISPWPPIPLSTAGPLPTTSTASHSLPSAQEIYSLLTILLTSLFYVLYFIWSLAPVSYLEAIGWTWFPSQEWGLIVPYYLMIVVLLAYWSYAALTPLLTPSLDSPDLITDKYANIPSVGEGERYYWGMAEGKAAEAVDLPIDLEQYRLHADLSGLAFGHGVAVRMVREGSFMNWFRTGDSERDGTRWLGRFAARDGIEIYKGEHGWRGEGQEEQGRGKGEKAEE